MAYDAMLLAAIVFLAALPLPAVPDSIQQTWWFRTGLRGYLLGVSFLFFGWFWVHGGQTLGMRAWRIRLVTAAGGRPAWRHALIRFPAALLSLAPLGLGFCWSLVDSRRRTWHDILSRTRLVVVPR